MDTDQFVTDEMRQQFWDDGVVVLPQVLDPSWMDLVELGITRNLRQPGPYFARHYQGTPREFIDDYCNYAAVGEARRTPWHQDTTYWITEGSQIAGFWIPLDDTPAEASLEFVRASHLGPTFAGTAFDYADDTTPFTAGDTYPRIPDIEADRSSFDIVSFPI